MFQSGLSPKREADGELEHDYYLYVYRKVDPSTETYI